MSQMNFFTQLTKHVNKRCTLTIGITAAENGEFRVTVQPRYIKTDEEDIDNILAKIPPLMLTGTPEELDAEFASKIIPSEALIKSMRIADQIPRFSEKIDKVLAELTEELEPKTKTKPAATTA